MSVFLCLKRFFHFDRSEYVISFPFIVASVDLQRLHKLLTLIKFSVSQRKMAHYYRLARSTKPSVYVNS